MEKTEEKATSQIGVKSFMTSIIVIGAMMILTYGMTFLIPGGSISFGKWILSPILILFWEENDSLFAIIALLVGLGGVFQCLEQFGILKILLDKITEKFAKNRKVLLAVTVLFFMLLGSVAGTYEECVPLVPLAAFLAIRLGWDSLTGLGMSILATGCGFAAGICNPFTIGVAQELAGVPLFSGLWFRVVSFIAIYLLLMTFLFRYVKQKEKTQVSICTMTDERKGNFESKERGIIGKLRLFLMTFIKGVISVLPGILLILMANSIRFTMVEGKILEPILQGAIEITRGLPRWSVILFLYALVLFLNFFIPSGSAKAFLLMPLMIPVAQVFDISAQLCVMAFAFGDGFSNVFYPTNPVLLISLGLTNVSYGKWVKWSLKFQLLNLVLTSGILLLGVMIGY